MVVHLPRGWTRQSCCANASGRVLALLQPKPLRGVHVSIFVGLASVLLTTVLSTGRPVNAVLLVPWSGNTIASGGHYFSQDLVVVYTDAGWFKATNEGWRQLLPQGGGDLSVGLGGALYYYRHATYEVQRSLDGGETWTMRGTFPFTETTSSESLSASPLTNTVFMGVSYTFPMTGTLKGIYKSTNGGMTWRRVLDNYDANLITFSPNFAQDGIAFTEFGSYKMTFGVWKTTDWGETWSDSSNGLPVGTSLTGYILSISPQFAQDQTVFAISDSGVFKSVDGGESWLRVGKPPGYLPIQIAVSPNYINDQTLLTGDYNEGLFLSQDGGESWRHINFAVSPRQVGIRHIGPYQSWPPLSPPEPYGPYRIYLPFVNIYRAEQLEFWVVAYYPWPDHSRLYRSRDHGVTWEEVQVFEKSHWLYMPFVSRAVSGD